VLAAGVEPAQVVAFFAQFGVKDGARSLLLF
jgi:hypothetical protein